MRTLILIVVLSIPVRAQEAKDLDITTWNVSSIVPMTEDFVFLHRVDPISLGEAFVVFKLPTTPGGEYVFLFSHARIGKRCFNIDRDAKSGFGVPIKYETTCTLFNRLKASYEMFRSKRLDKVSKT